VYNLLTVWRRLQFLFAVFFVAIGLWRLEAARSGIEIARERVGPVPLTIYRPAAGPPAPAVVIAHGFAGSQPLMQPLAVTLARAGYVAATFDFPGHGRHPAPLPGGLADRAARTDALLEALAAVAAFVRAQPYADGRLALVGHSMASDVVVRHAEAHPDVAATVAISLFLSGEVTADRPRNLLVVYGALEPEALRNEGARAIGAAAAATPGHFAEGTARRLALADGVEHIGVLYSAATLAETRDWLNAAFGRDGGGFLDARGPWLGLLFLGLVLAARPFAGLAPRVAAAPLGAGYGWRTLAPIAIAPAVLTPLVLRFVPVPRLPILLGDYLAAHFALYGALTALGLLFAARRRGPRAQSPVAYGKLALVALAAAAYATFALGLPADRYAMNFLPGPGRLPLFAALFAGTLAYFAADEWLTRGRGAARGGYPATKLLFLASLAGAIALDLPRLFFLAIIVPAILAFFVVYGLFSRWLYRATNHPFAGASANAFAFAWAIAVTFPIVGR
jgi:dienelactone hydrolase